MVFAGGSMVHVKFAQPTPIGDIRAALSRPELKEVIVQDVGKGGQEFQIRVVGAEHGGATAIADGIKTGLKDRFGEGTYDVLRVARICPPTYTSDSMCGDTSPLSSVWMWKTRLLCLTSVL